MSFLKEIVIPRKLKELANYLENSNRLIIYGNGKIAELFIKEHSEINVVGIIDSNENVILATINFNTIIDEPLNYKNIPILITSKWTGNLFLDIFDENIKENVYHYFAYDISKNISKIKEVSNGFFDQRSYDVYNGLLEYFTSLDSNNFKKITDYDVQYFDSDLFNMKDCATFIDGGAYHGESVRDFIRFTNGNYNNIYCFEPDYLNYEALEKNIAEFKNVYCYQKGLGDNNEYVTFSQAGNSSSHVSADGNLEIIVTKIDDIEEPRIDLIKMDIEGYELNALKGSINTILKFKPYLAICIYHKPEDLWEIPLFINSLNMDYNISIRHYNDVCRYETVAYFF